jgi:hypothetical protein
MTVIFVQQLSVRKLGRHLSVNMVMRDSMALL